MYGGVDEDYLNDMYFFYPNENRFVRVYPKGVEPPRLSNAECVLSEEGSVYYFGGYSLTGLQNDLYRYDV